MPFKRHREEKCSEKRKRLSVKAEAEAGVVLPQAMECLELPEANAARKFSPPPPPPPSEGTWHCRKLDFKLLGSRIVRE